MTAPRGRPAGRTDGRTDPATEKPPVCNTGAQLTVHWLRGGTWAGLDGVVERLAEATGGGDVEVHGWGRFMYRQHYQLVLGMAVYFDPVADNMPPVLVDIPGTACEALGLAELRALHVALGLQLTRADLAFDDVGFTPRDAAEWVREGNVRCRSQKRKFIEDLGGKGDGETLTLGSRSSSRFLRIYDGRGFTRVELELKEEAARGFGAILAAELDGFASSALGVLRDFVDFVDAEQDANVSRAPLLPSWEALVGAVERVKVAVHGRTAPTVERVVHYLEHQVSAMLAVYHDLGHSVDALVDFGKQRFQHRHRALLALGNVTAT